MKILMVLTSHDRLNNLSKPSHGSSEGPLEGLEPGATGHRNTSTLYRANTPRKA